MPWDNSRPVANPKYRSKAHRAKVAEYKRDLERLGHLECQAVVCVMSTRTITNSNGNERDGLTAGHNDDGLTYRGPEHRACNIHDAAKRANAKGRGVSSIRRWVL